MPKKANGKLRVIPLGGLNEIGKNMTVIEYENIVRLDPHIPCQLCVGVQMAVFAVNGHEVLRTSQRLHQLDLLLAGMTRNVHLGDRIVQNGDAVMVELIDDASDQFFVAGYSTG